MSDVREALEAAFDKAEGGTDTEAAAPGGDTGSHREGVEALPPAAGEGGADVSGDANAAAGDSGPGQTAAQRARDAAGRFVPKAAASPTEAPKQGDATPAPVAPKPGTQTATEPPQTGTQTATPAPEMKGPQSWRPEARELFPKLPPQVQQEAMRIDKEVRQTIREATAARQFAEHFEKTTAPLRELGVNPAVGLNNYVQATTLLSRGAPEQKAAFLANIIRQSNVPIEMLDAALTGQPLPQGAHQPPPVDPEAIARQAEERIFQRLQAQRAQVVSQQATKEVETFAANAEFLEDVRDDVAVIMESAARQGRAMTLEQAYGLACKVHPEVSKVLQQREAAARATATQATTQRSRIAASSVRSQPASAPPGNQGGGSLRDDLEAALATVGGR